jgi:hypothetical protein
MAEYPEHEKLEKIQPQSQIVGEFLEWMQWKKRIVFTNYHYHSDNCYDDEGMKRCGYFEDYLYPMWDKIEDLLAEFFEIDQNKINDEKEVILQEIRNQSTKV